MAQALTVLCELPGRWLQLLDDMLDLLDIRHSILTGESF